MISTSIKLDGEAAFKKQLGDVNSNLRTLDSSMKLVTEQFKGQANSLEALTAKDRILSEQVEQQTEKVRALEEALGQAAEAYGENDKRVDNYHRSLNEARTQLIRMQRELQDNAKYLDEARHSADRAATSIDGFGREVEQVDDQTAGFGNALGGVVSNLGKLKGAIIGGAAVGAIKELGGAILEVEESTREYRSIMGTLEVSSEQAGYTAAQTAEAYGRLQSVLEDPQTAATATANLQAIGLEQEELMKITDMAIGAWATYGDSIPIDGLAEAINETIQAGTVTGTFADVVNWAGESEDAFNEKLAAANTTTERANLVMELMAQQGLTDAANGWFEVNEQIVAANQTQERLNAAYAALGETIAPLADLIRNGWAGAVEFATEKVDIAIDSVMELKNWFDKTADSIRQMSNWSLGDLWDALTTVPGLETQAKAASVTGGLTGAELREKNLRATDIVSASQAAARNATYAVDAMANRGSFSARITLATEDGRNLGQYLTPFVNEENAANPPVRSDPL